ncbi:MAG: glycine cleavage system protein GcvH [Alphaproteobacteria bacterium]|nr:MAG: glycine cleavage system protein GcvH [Alphaproteobacteria bacterium]
MSERKYTKDHEWIVVDADVGTVGISNHAQEQLGDVVFVELPEVGRTVARGDEVATVESVKAASEIYAPVSGEIMAVNDALGDDPALVNGDPLGKGWFFKIKLSNPAELDELMDEATYEAYAAGQA